LAVNDVSFDVRPGEIFAFLGPNGAGKTTTIKMLTTLLRPTTGSLELDGLDVTMHPTEVRKRLGVVFQDPSLDSELTAWENVDLHGVLYHVPPSPARARRGAAQVVRAVGPAERSGQDVFRRDATPARDCAGALAHAQGVVSGRADFRARSAESQSDVDHRQEPECD